MDTPRALTIDPELARRLKRAAAAGRSVTVTIDDRIYRLTITPEPVADLWEGYDPEGVRSAVRRSAALGSCADPDELDSLIAEIRAQRDQSDFDGTT